MKLVRRMSLLVALALVLTVGGVYAAWIYSNTNANGVAPGVSHAMAAVSDEKTPNGTIAIVSNSTNVKIDQKAEGDYTAIPVFVVSFTPANMASDDVKANAIPVSAVLNVINPTNSQYEGKDIFFAGETVDLEWEKQDDGSFHATLDISDLAKIVGFGEFVLPTIDDYTAFQEAMSVIRLEVKINPVEAP